ncbi:MAG: MFS transporter [Rudaea sp.]
MLEYCSPAFPMAGDGMQQTDYQVYSYRWVMLLGFMAIVAVNQLFWITFAPITSAAASYFQVSELEIGLLSLVFLVVYVVVSIPASWVIDTYGLRAAVGIGAALTGLFGLARGLAAPDYSLVLISQLGIAIGQPFLLNATTTVAARWFPLTERATATGLGSLAIYLGILTGLALTPYLLLQFDLGRLLFLYGVIGAVAAVILFAVARDRPPTPPGPAGQDERSLVLDGLRQMLRRGQFVLLLVIFFVGLGVFNAVTTWIEEILRPRGFSITQAGDAGGLMILGGILGALVVPTLSDRVLKRTPFLVLALAGATLGLAGVAFVTNYWLLLASAFLMGFCLLSAGPIGFQYGAELTWPAPEGTSNGLLLLMGQISGILFIFGMDGFKSDDTGSMSGPLIVLIALMLASVLLSTRLKEARMPATKIAGDA